MKKVLLGLALIGLTAGANADPTDLCGGALIVHQIPDPIGTFIDPCEDYEQYGITHHSEQNNAIYTTSYSISLWWVIAAWEEDKEFCGVQFGLSDYDPAVFAYGDYNACFPATGGLEIPSPGWPGPNEGIAFVVTGDAWSGNYLPVYWFRGYAYGGSYAAPGVVQLIPDPTVAQPFGGTGNCVSPPEKWDALLGGLGINMGGTYVEPFTCEVTGACCVDIGCYIMTGEECEAQGGEYMGDGTDCEPDPCPVPWACCIFGECIEVLESQCEAAGGEFFLGEHCTAVTCRAYAVCCVGPHHHDCILAFEDECEAQGGLFFPDWDSCDPNLCIQITGPDKTSWGTIKSLYR